MLVIDCVAHIFKELYYLRYAVIDDVQYNQGVYLLVFIKAWEIQERHRENELKNDPALTGMMV